MIRARAQAARMWLRAHKSATVLMALMIGLSGANLLWTARETRAVGRDFCGIVSGVTSVPVPRPADAAANPSRETAWEWYERFVQLGQHLGC